MAGAALLGRLRAAGRLAVSEPASGRSERRQARIAARRRRLRFVLVIGALAASLAYLMVNVARHVQHSQVATGETCTIALLTGAGRGAPVSELIVPANAARVRLQIEVVAADEYARYRLSIADADRHDLFAASDLAPKQAGPIRYVEAEMPADTLGAGTRYIAVSAQAPASFAFAAEYRVKHSAR
jgi:hypothetical protein